MTAIEFADRQGDAVDAARRNHGGNAAAVWEPGIEDRLRFRNIVS